jgi:transcriptional antiterminator NusG
MKWYIIRVQTNREKSISEKIIKESEKGDLIGKIGRVLVPVEKCLFIRNGKKMIREKVIFPNYIFIETNAIGELKQFIKGVSGVSGLLTNKNGDVQSLSQADVDNMLSRYQSSQEKETVNTFFIGDEVKVLDGPYVNFSGIVEEVNDQKLKISILIFGRKIPVELSVLQVEKK